MKAFKNAPLQHIRLKQCQILKYGEKRALCLSVITRWGTQFRLINSLLNNKEALREYIHKYNEVPDEIQLSIRSSAFWIQLEILKELLQPIDEAITMSESDKSHLGMIISRWATIRSHLVRMKADFPVLEEFIQSDHEKAFPARFKRQVNDIHRVATYLTPTNYNLSLDMDDEYRIFSFFQKYMSSETDSAKAREEFRDFRKQRRAFGSDRFCWKDDKDPKAF